MKTKEYLEKCGKLHPNFEASEAEWFLEEDIKEIDDVAQGLSTYLYDRSFGVDEESWEELERIAEIFGSDIRYQVLKNMFYRNHDT